MANTILLRSAFHHVAANPQEWDQGDWRRCLAAHVVRKAGGQFVTDDLTEEANMAVVATADEIETCDQRFFLLPDGAVAEGVWVWERACRLLQITPLQGKKLFAPTNSLEDLRQQIHDLCEVA